MHTYKHTYIHINIHIVMCTKYIYTDSQIQQCVHICIHIDTYIYFHRSGILFDRKTIIDNYSTNGKALVRL